LKIGILTRNAEGWCSRELRRALGERGVEAVCIGFRHLLAYVARKPSLLHDGLDVVSDLSALLVRPIGRGSLEEIVFRLDVLHRLGRLGLPVVNKPSAIEKAVDKYYALCLFEEGGLRVPETAVTTDADAAIAAFNELGGDVVVKPVFGSRGMGSTRVSDSEIATRVFRTLVFHHQVIYIQRFIPHGVRDIRAVVVGGRVVSAMYRVARGWKTNVSQGAKPVAAKLPTEYGELALRAAEALGCEVGGADILETDSGPLVLEVNSQPGWRGLQSISDVDIAGEIADYLIGVARR